jgi:hypothetical protein
MIGIVTANGHVDSVADTGRLHHQVWFVSGSQRWSYRDGKVMWWEDPDEESMLLVNRHLTSKRLKVVGHWAYDPNLVMSQSHYRKMPAVESLARNLIDDLVR